MRHWQCPCNVKFMLEGEEEIRIAEPLQVLRRLQEDAQGRHNTGVGHLYDIYGYAVDHMRPARPYIYGEVEVTGPNKDLHWASSAAPWPTQPTC